MNLLTEQPVRDRHDRFVRSARLRVNAEASRHRLAFALEEALRLMSLPGEEQGRAYYFRSLRVVELPPSGDRGVWLDWIERALVRKAMQAVHGADSQAGLADAVYFHSEQEALEILLHRMLLHGVAKEWFWPMALGRREQRGLAPASILEVVMRVQAHPSSWVGVAAALFAQPGLDAVRLLRAIPAETASDWIEAMDRTDGRPVLGGLRVVHPAVEGALRLFGEEHPGVLWLATLAVLLEEPSDLANGSAVCRARATLRGMAFERRPVERENGRVGELPISSSDMRQEASNRREKEVDAEGLRQEARTSASTLRDDHRAFVKRADESDAIASLDATAGPSLHQAAPLEGGGLREPAAHLTESPELASLRDVGYADSHGSEFAVALNVDAHSQAIDRTALPAHQPWLAVGMSTDAAGLFFLLNAMRQIGMEEAIASGLPVPHFVPRVLRLLAMQAGVAPDDAALQWLASLVSDSEPIDAPRIFDAACWPTNLTPSSRLFTGEDFVRIWALSARRWCWRGAGLSAHETIARAGVFSVNRTDLDLSLPIDAADVRVRKAGLDLDPGWLPWFGRVVRFHYVSRGELRG